MFIYCFLLITAQIFAHLIDSFWSHDWFVTPSCQLILDSWYYCRTEGLWVFFTCLEPRLLGSSIHVGKTKIWRQIENFGNFWCIFCNSSFIMTCTRNISTFLHAITLAALSLYQSQSLNLKQLSFSSAVSKHAPPSPFPFWGKRGLMWIWSYVPVENSHSQYWENHRDTKCTSINWRGVYYQIHLHHVAN